MGKINTISELVKLLAHSLTHKIGSMVNKEDPYAEKYSKESINFFNLAKKTSLEENWNSYDKRQILSQLRKELKDELERKDFLDKKKFEFINEEIIKILKELDLY